MHDCPRKDPAVRDELLADGTMVLFHTASRQLMTLNQTAALVWEYCDGVHDRAGIVRELQALFSSAANVTGDVDEILRELQNRGMLAAADAADGRDA
jgi:hypothetical protein